MDSVSRSAAALAALLAAIPITVIIGLVIWELFVAINNGATLDPYQIFLTIFCGFSFGLAVYSYVYAARMQA